MVQFENASCVNLESDSGAHTLLRRTIKVKNCAFPLFVSEAVLNREKAHIEGFAAEVAWVTHA